MDKNGNKLPTQGMLLARILIGGYLVYLGFSLFGGRAESSMKPIVLWLFIIIFCVIGIYLLVNAFISYNKGYYIEGSADVGTIEEDSENIVDVEETDEKDSEATENIAITEKSEEE